MASIDTGGGDGGHKKGPGVKKAKKLSTRVDMTPMVDLGFLLITFFVFTATMSTPTTLDLNMPKDVKDPKKQTEVKNSGALTILLGKDNNVFYYEGQLKVAEGENNFKSSTFKEIRQVIIDKKAEVIKNFNPANVDPKLCEEEKAKAKKKGDPNWEDACKDMDFVVIIKPTDEATYKNTVDILDEMSINQVKRYALVKVGEEELKLIKATEDSQKK
ncbi:MAG: biopolymer transporter ExbD [Chitinophagaceae bacterium]|nr:biopolymer transporter ExbD [Chitinophagaceae bacterium]